MTPTLPDVLVLGGGGVLGEAWMAGMLAGIEDATGLDLRRCEHFVGTSAGSIVAARLAAGERPERGPARLELTAGEPEAEPGGVPQDTLLSASGGVLSATARAAGAWAQAAGIPLAPVALGLAAPGGALLRAAALRAIRAPSRTLGALGERLERAGARFDGRLRIVAVERASGRRVVFGGPHSPAATVAEAVQASCSVPWLFAPVTIGGREYVDGGLWSPTNLDVAPAWRDTHVLCLNPTGGLAGAHPLLGLARGAARSAATIEGMALRRRGARVRILAPDAGVAAAIGPNFMDSRPRERVLALSYRQGLSGAAAATGS